MENEFEVQRSLGRIEGGISELKTEVALLRDDHAGLRAEFNKLEAGRFTKLESDFASQRAMMHAKAKNVAIIYSVVSAVLVSVLTAFIINIIFK